jgi:hypothetical protein
MAGNKGIIEACIRSNPDVERVLNHGRWTDAASAAIAYFVHGVECTNKEWLTSETWRIVERAYRDCK